MKAYILQIAVSILSKHHFLLLLDSEKYDNLTSFKVYDCICFASQSVADCLQSIIRLSRSFFGQFIRCTVKMKTDALIHFVEKNKGNFCSTPTNKHKSLAA